jgi:hypothetical protein
VRRSALSCLTMSNLPDLEAILECIICHAVPCNGPIFQCHNGHLVCKECSEKTAAATSCAMCQEPLPQKKIRCIAVEQAIEKIDFVAVNGCDFMSVRKTLEKHEEDCESRLVPCPDGCCPESLSLNKLLQHLEDKAIIVIQPASEIYSLFWTCSFKGMDILNLEWTVKICNYANTTFIMKFARNKGMFYAWLHIAAGADVAEKYQVKITIAKNKTLLSHTGKVFTIDVKEKEVTQEDEDILSFGTGLFKKLAIVEDEKHRICMEYEILKV